MENLTTLTMDELKQLQIAINREIFVRMKSEGLKLEKIIDTCCEELGVSYENLKSKSRKRKLVNARKSISLIALRLGFTQTHIGDLLGGRDHSTIHYYREISYNHLVDDLQFVQTYNTCINALGIDGKIKIDVNTHRH